MQWVKDRIPLGGLFNRHSRFSRNDSSNSNSSASNSAPPTNAPNTPIFSTPTHKFVYNHHSSPSGNGSSNHHHKASRHTSNSSTNVTFQRQTSFFKRSVAASASVGSVGGSGSGHGKLSAKSSTASSIASVNTTPVNTGGSGSLRRKRFKQQYQARLERRLSRQTSSGTSVSTSQELSSSGTSITANPIIDRILEYVRDNYVKTIDPFKWDINRKVRLTSFASFRIESGLLSGTSNFERIGDSKLIKSIDEFTQIVLSSNILFTDIVADFQFSTKLARFTMHNKQLRIFVEKCIFYVEISIDHTMSARLKVLRLITLDGVETKCRGIAFPLNKSIDSFALKTIHMMAANSDQYTEQIVPLVNQFCDNLFENALKSLSISDLFW